MNIFLFRLQFPLQGVADHVNLGLIPTSEAGWPVACAALRCDKGGWLHVHGNVTSGLTNFELDTFSSKKEKESRLNSHPSSMDSIAVIDDRTMSSSITTANNEDRCLNGADVINAQELEDSLSSPSKMSSFCLHSLHDTTSHLPSCNKKIKPEWLDWAGYVAQSLLGHLKKLHDPKINWNVQICHIEHIKSYAPHIDHIVLDVECRPLL